MATTKGKHLLDAAMNAATLARSAQGRAIVATATGLRADDVDRAREIWA